MCAHAQGESAEGGEKEEAGGGVTGGGEGENEGDKKPDKEPSVEETPEPKKVGVDGCI